MLSVITLMLVMLMMRMIVIVYNANVTLLKAIDSESREKMFALLWSVVFSANYGFDCCHKAEWNQHPDGFIVFQPPGVKWQPQIWGSLWNQTNWCDSSTGWFLIFCIKVCSLYIGLKSATYCHIKPLLRISKNDDRHGNPDETDDAANQILLISWRRCCMMRDVIIDDAKK